VSIKAINWALNVVSGITSTQKAILIALADRANEDNQCWPSYEDICARSCANQKTVASALKALEQHGFIKKTRRYSQSTLYQLLITTDIGHISSTDIGSISSTDIGHTDTPNIGNLTIKEPSKEPPKEKHSRKVPDGVDSEAWRNWVKYRRKFKAPTTERALTLVANKLRGVSVEEQRDAVDKAIECGWRSVFPKEKNEIREHEF
jgi:pyocin large subunit-like protein